jgi:hypothetical protein
LKKRVGIEKRSNGNAGGRMAGRFFDGGVIILDVGQELQDLPGELVAYVKLATSTELTNELSLKRVINVATSYL